MSNTPEAGLKAIFSEVMTTIVYQAVLQAFRPALGGSYVLLIDLLGLGLMAIFVLGMFSWGILYTIGWYIGAYLLINAGLLGPLEIALYVIAPIAIWAVRIYMEQNK